MKPHYAACLLGLVTLALAQPKPLPPDAATQQGLAPDGVLAELVEGNSRYARGIPTNYDLAARMNVATKGQHPKAYVLSCVDSRVPVEQIFDQSIGDIFVGRVAGNIGSDDQIGSMEFATKVAGAKLVLVLGHEGCGAVQGACDHVRMGNLTGVLKQIEPAVQSVEGYPQQDRHSKNPKFVHEVICHNVARTIARIRRSSEILASLEKEGKIRIVGGYYSLQDGTVTLLP